MTSESSSCAFETRDTLYPYYSQGSEPALTVTHDTLSDLSAPHTLQLRHSGLTCHTISAHSRHSSSCLVHARGESEF